MLCIEVISWGLYLSINFETLLSRPRASITKSYYRNIRIVQSNNRNQNIRIVGWNGSQEQTKTESSKKDFEIDMPLSRIVCHWNFRIYTAPFNLSNTVISQLFRLCQKLLFTMKLSFNTEWLRITADYRDKYVQPIDGSGKRFT